MDQRFAHIETWVFDLDNTLYPKEARLFDQIDVKMTEFVMRETGLARAEADALRDRYYQELGTTLAGLMRDFNTAPDPYLVDVHQIDLGHLNVDHALADAITSLPGRKIIHTNGSRFHAERVAQARGLLDCFDAVYGVEHVDFIPKPHPDAFDKFYALIDADPRSAAFFEDEPRNLRVPYSLGVTTVLVGQDTQNPFIDHHTEDLGVFLRKINPSQDKGVAEAL